MRNNIKASLSVLLTFHPLNDYHQLDDDYGSTLEDIEPLMLSSEEVDAYRGKYIRRLTAVLILHVPAFWKTAQSVSSGKFAKVISCICYCVINIPLTVDSLAPS